MIRYIPSFILYQYEQKALTGEIEAFVVQFDIVDFTESCSVLFTQPKGGVETLSSYLDAAFHIPIETLGRFGGFVAGFSGDACSVIIPDAKPEEVLTAVRLILRHFTEVSQVENLPLKIRLNVTYGKVQWVIFENEHQNEYIFAGEAFEDTIRMQTLRLPVAFSKRAAEQIGPDGFLMAGDGYEPKKHILDSAHANSRHAEYSFKASTRAKFCDSHFSNCKPSEEYQPAGYCFISLKSIPESELPAAIREIDRQAHKYKGLVNKLEKSDKGFLAIVLFGIPKKDGEIYGDLCKFSLKLIKYLPKLKIGLSIGYVLACFTGSGLAKEYTAFGHPMNLAARFMTIAKPGEIIVDEYLRELEDTQFHFTDMGSVPLKGMEKQNKNVKYHSLSRAVAHRDMYSRREFVGRREEQDQLVEILSSSLRDKINKIIYIHGDSGMGKSRLIEVVLSQIDSNSCTRYNVDCEENNSKDLDGIKQIMNQLTNFNPWIDIDESQAMFHGLWLSKAMGDKEMLRIEPILGSLWGYDWPDSNWKKFSEAEKPKQLKAAIIYCLNFLAKNKPILLSIEDSQWLDPLSMTYLQDLSKLDANPVIAITSCRYLSDGKVDLNLQHHESVHLDLGRLDIMETGFLIKSLLRTDKEIPRQTTEFIDSIAQGIPLFVEQLTLSMIENKKMNRSGKLENTDGYDHNLKIDSVVKMRIDSLTDRVQHCLYNAAVLGNQFYVEVLSKMLNTKLETELEQGRSNRIWDRYIDQELSSISDDFDELQYKFSHVLFKEVAYGTMLDTMRYNLHFAAARAMEKVFRLNLEKHAEVIAGHYRDAKLFDAASEMYCKAGDYYKGIYNYLGAARSYQKALEMREEQDKTRSANASRTETVPTINNWAEQLICLGNPQYLHEAESKLDRALDLIQVYQKQALCDKATSLALQSRIMEESSNYPKAVSLLNKALSLRKTHLDSKDKLIGKTMHDLGNLYYKQGVYAQSGIMFEQAIGFWKRCGMGISPEMADSINDLARLYAAQEKNEEAEEMFDQALNMRKQTLGTEHIDLSETLNDLADYLIDRDRYPEAEPLLVKALEIRELTFGPNHRQVAETCHSLGNLYRERDDFDTAEDYFKRSFAIREILLGKNHPDIAESMQGLADLYFEKGKFDLAISHYNKALAIRREILDPGNPDIAETLNGLGNALRERGDDDEASGIFQQAREIEEKVLGSQSSLLAEIYNGYAETCFKLSNYPEAEKNYLKALQIRKQNFGEQSLDAAESMNDLANLYVKMNVIEKAEKLFLEALQIRKLHDEKGLDVAESMNSLASFYLELNDDKLAESYLLQALEIREEKLDYMHPHLAETMNDLAHIYVDREDFDLAISYLKRALVIRRKLKKADYAESLEELAGLYRDKGLYAESEPLFQEAMEIRTRTQGESHPDYADTLHEFGTMYLEKNDLGKAEEYICKALLIRKKRLGADHPDVADSLSKLAEVRLEQDQYGESKELFEEAMEIRSKSTRPNDLSLADTWHDMAILHLETGNYDLAEQLLVNSKQVREAVLGFNHSEVAESINDLARLYYKQGLYNKAKPLFEEALKLRETELDPRHRDVADTLNDLGCLSSALGSRELAKDYLLRALDIRRNKLGADNPDTLETQANLERLDRNDPKDDDD